MDSDLSNGLYWNAFTCMGNPVLSDAAKIEVLPTSPENLSAATNGSFQLHKVDASRFILETDLDKKAVDQPLT